MSKMRKPRKNMRQQCEFRTNHLPVRAWCDERPQTETEDTKIDLDRVVWDPEYRHEVLATMRPSA